jgi:murein DD-endopeptidase MepM/ murein hydrolase activator NlpD
MSQSIRDQELAVITGRSDAHASGVRTLPSGRFQLGPIPESLAGRYLRMARVLLAVIVLVGLSNLVITHRAYADSRDPDSAEDPTGAGKHLLRYSGDPAGHREDILEYTVEDGDTLYDIAARFAIQLETLVWANDLENNPNRLSIGQKLIIMPVDGVLYTVKAGDTLGGIADKYKASQDAIQSFSANHLDGQNPSIQPGQELIIPGGIKPKPAPPPPPPPAPKPPEPPAQSPAPAGATAPQQAVPAAATGHFAWPITGFVSQGYLPYHRAIDILGQNGQPIQASDTGRIAYAGWSDDGYGYHVVIDHGNGYRTLYAHMSRIDVVVGQAVQQGDVIGAVGATGRATAYHVHFEIEQGGVRLNPADFLK